MYFLGFCFFKIDFKSQFENETNLKLDRFHQYIPSLENDTWRHKIKHKTLIFTNVLLFATNI